MDLTQRMNAHHPDIEALAALLTRKPPRAGLLVPR